MWLSFASNVLIFLTGLTVFQLLAKGDQLWFRLFFLITGISSLLAAFGHLPLLDQELSANILFCSRFFSIVALFFFVIGIIITMPLKRKSLLIQLWSIITAVALGWLIFYNEFTPVALLGIVGLVLFSLPVLLVNTSYFEQSLQYFCVGIYLNVLAAVIFGFEHKIELFKASDLSHLMMAISLVFFGINVSYLQQKNESVQSDISA